MDQLRSVGNAKIRLLRWINSQVWNYWLEIIAVLLLTTASLATAWNGYQAARWGGVQSTAYSQASAKRVQASDASSSGFIEMFMDVEVFNDFADAYTSNDTQLMAFLERQFSDRLRPAVDAWLETSPLTNPDAPGSPLEMSEYTTPSFDRAAQLSDEADALFASGLDASDKSDQYILNTVYLATALFFAGIAGKVVGRPARTMIVVVGIAMLLFGLYHIFSLPIQ
ncbi:MAG: hypothetical protein M9890_05580 [Thermomicrobiales bacterium]|nr:hypothetical protein [Thermomicrobiales bacterium]